MTKGGIRALVIDQEAAMRRYLRLSLVAQGYTVFEANSGQEALSTINARRPDVVILDLELPDLDGIEVTSLLRQWSQVPILVISNRAVEALKITALDAGADDYLIKPFGMGELLARLRVAVRRASGPSSAPVFSVDELTVDLERRMVRVAGREVALTPTEYDLLRALVAHAGKVLTHHQLLRAVWGLEYEGKTHLLRVNISNLRTKIEPNAAHPRYILTVPGVGYRLQNGA
ncbi:MAG: response regulator [Chloroflexi bacterium]|nr:MAG: response regulator [Chloroflexota bacterium]